MLSYFAPNQASHPHEAKNTSSADAAQAKGAIQMWRFTGSLTPTSDTSLEKLREKTLLCTLISLISAFLSISQLATTFHAVRLVRSIEDPVVSVTNNIFESLPAKIPPRAM